jgi:uncharacterized protein (DUF1330 family)
MNAFLVLDLAINDFAGFSHYMAAIPSHIARYDGRYIVKGAVPTCIEGDWRPQRMVIIEWRAVAEQIALALLDAVLYVATLARCSAEDSPPSMQSDWDPSAVHAKRETVTKRPR